MNENEPRGNPARGGRARSAKARLFQDVLERLKQQAPYFRSADVAPLARELGLEISRGTLRVYLSEARARGLIHDAGRGWYSRLSEPVPLNPKAVSKLIRAVERAFPLLEFTAWSTAQINPWMHHLLAQPVAFLHAPPDTLESIGDTLRSQGWEVAVNPPPSVGPKSVGPGEKMVVLRPAMSKQPPGNRPAGPYREDPRGPRRRSPPPRPHGRFRRAKCRRRHPQPIPCASRCFTTICRFKGGKNKRN